MSTSALGAWWSGWRNIWRHWRRRAAWVTLGVRSARSSLQVQMMIARYCANTALVYFLRTMGTALRRGQLRRLSGINSKALPSYGGGRSLVDLDRFSYESTFKNLVSYNVRRDWNGGNRTLVTPYALNYRTQVSTTKAQPWLEAGGRQGSRVGAEGRVHERRLYVVVALSSPRLDRVGAEQAPARPPCQHTGSIETRLKCSGSQCGFLPS